ncbi:phosphate signaling complex protein PhoU [Corticicoccus populi]|uniref:Phosphate-specific transport system accessory protein PhoU n=1 Tax=Corticicoccus populi TaxID=1812821 RepID=A0ABW5WSF5_9STAP
MTSRVKFSNDLNTLIDEVIDMGRKVYSRLDGVTNCLSIDDMNTARKIVYDDSFINELEYRINTRAITMITAESPVATDLRVIIASIKTAMELERISDNISNIAEVRKRIKIENDNLLLRLYTMERLAVLMMNDIYTAFREKDMELCLEILDRDEDIDRLFVQISTSDILEESDLFVSGQCQLCAKYLERIGDHIKNIAEHVYFINTGERFEVR